MKGHDWPETFEWTIKCWFFSTFVTKLWVIDFFRASFQVLWQNGGLLIFFVPLFKFCDKTVGYWWPRSSVGELVSEWWAEGNWAGHASLSPFSSTQTQIQIQIQIHRFNWEYVWHWVLHPSYDPNPLLFPKFHPLHILGRLESIDSNSVSDISAFCFYSFVQIPEKRRTIFVRQLVIGNVKLRITSGNWKQGNNNVTIVTMYLNSVIVSATLWNLEVKAT